MRKMNVIPASPRFFPRAKLRVRISLCETRSQMKKCRFQGFLPACVSPSARRCGTGLYGISCGTERRVQGSRCRKCTCRTGGSGSIRRILRQEAVIPMHPCTQACRKRKDEFVRMPPELLKAACTMSHKLGLKGSGSCYDEGRYRKCPAGRCGSH